MHPLGRYVPVVIVARRAGSHPRARVDRALHPSVLSVRAESAAMDILWGDDVVRQGRPDTLVGIDGTVKNHDWQCGRLSPGRSRYSSPSSSTTRQGEGTRSRFRAGAALCRPVEIRTGGEIDTRSAGFGLFGFLLCPVRESVGWPTRIKTKVWVVKESSGFVVAGAANDKKRAGFNFAITEKGYLNSLRTSFHVHIVEFGAFTVARMWTVPEIIVLIKDKWSGQKREISRLYCTNGVTQGANLDPLLFTLFF